MLKGPTAGAGGREGRPANQLRIAESLGQAQARAFSKNLIQDFLEVL